MLNAAHYLPRTANTYEATTHVAVAKNGGFKYFCYYVSEEDRYYISPCKLYSNQYQSLYQPLYDFIPLNEWEDFIDLSPIRHRISTLQWELEVQLKKLEEAKERNQCEINVKYTIKPALIRSGGRSGGVRFTISLIPPTKSYDYENIGVELCLNLNTREVVKCTPMENMTTVVYSYNAGTLNGTQTGLNIIQVPSEIFTEEWNEMRKGNIPNRILLPHWKGKLVPVE